MKTELGMFNHLKKAHTETMRGHLRILDGFTCEEGSVRWKQEWRTLNVETTTTRNLQSLNRLSTNNATSCQRSGVTEPLVISSASTVKQTPTNGKKTMGDKKQ